MSQEAKAVVEAFFNAFGVGDMDGLMATFHENVEIVAGGIEVVPIYGKYEGKKGVAEFLGNLGSTYDTQQFSVDNIVAEGDIVFAFGHFKHRVIPTNKLFESDWVLRCQVADNKIISYKFFEDTAAAQATFSA